MARFLIEVPHEAEPVACARTVEVFLRSGSHFLTHADWGCRDGEHKAWFVADVDSKEDARSIVPPYLRPKTKIVKLNYFTFDDILPGHRGSPSRREEVSIPPEIC